VVVGGDLNPPNLGAFWARIEQGQLNMRGSVAGSCKDQAVVILRIIKISTSPSNINLAVKYQLSTYQP
jgi:hypothetical protein